MGKNQKGEWKVAVDIGISHGKPTKTEILRTSNAQTDPGTSAVDPAELFGIEKQFVAALEKRGHHAYSEVLSGEARLFRPGREPYTQKSEIRHLLENPTSYMSIITFAGGDIARSGDLAYVYGTATLETIAGGQKGSHSYLRFWKKENGHWKIVLDLISD